MNIDTSKISKFQLLTTLMMLIAGLWLIIEIFRGGISFSANWNMFKSPLGQVCWGIGFIMAIIWWGKFGHWSQTTVRVTKDQWGNVVKRETDYDLATSVSNSIIVPLVGHFIMEPLAYGAMIYYPIQCVIALVGAIFPYVVILVVLCLIAATWMLADRFREGRPRIAFISTTALLSLGMAALAFYIHASGSASTSSVPVPTSQGDPVVLESVDPASKKEGDPRIELKGDGIHAAHNIKLGDVIADLPKSVDKLYDSFTVGEETGMDDEELTVMTFKQKGADVFIAYSYDKTKIDWITVVSPVIQVQLYDRYYVVGEKITDLAKKEMAWDDAYGGMYFFKDFAIPYDVDAERIVSISIGESPF